MELKSSMFNVIKSPQDDRDFIISMESEVKDRPDLWVNNKEDHIVYSQGKSSTCVGFGCSGLVSQLEINLGKPYQRFSPASLYGNRFDVNEHQGEGQLVKNSLKDLKVDGVAKFEDFDYVGDVRTSKSKFLELSDEIREDMLDHRIKFYYKVNHKSIEEMYDVMKKFNSPLIISYGIYQTMAEGFTNGGFIPLPNEDEKMLGGHCSYIGGFINHDGQLKPAIVNSWGDDKFDNGIMYMPEDFPIWEAYLCIPYVKKEIRLEIGKSSYKVNGIKKQMDVTPIMRNDRMLVPLRFLMDELDILSIDWIQKSNTAIVKYGGDTLYFKAGEDHFGSFNMTKNIYYESDEGRKGLTVNYIDDDADRMLVPIRKVFEFIGCSVEWDGDNQEVIIRNY